MALTMKDELRCWKCKELMPTQFTIAAGQQMPADSWYMRNVAPDAASGGAMVPVHHRCWPAPNASGGF